MVGALHARITTFRMEKGIFLEAQLVFSPALRTSC